MMMIIVMIHDPPHFHFVVLISAMSISSNCCTPPILRADEFTEGAGPSFHKALKKAVKSKHADKDCIKTDPCGAPGLIWGFTCSKLCAWIYEPTAGKCVIYNELPIDVVLRCAETGERLLSKSWRPACLMQNRNKNGDLLKSLTVSVYRNSRYPERIVPKNPYFGRLMESELRLNHTYRLRSCEPRMFRKANLEMVLESRTLLPPWMNLEHLEMAEEKNNIQWALLTVRDDKTVSSDSAEGESGQGKDKVGEAKHFGPKHEPGTVFLVFRGTASIADMMIDAGGLPFYPPDIGLRIHGGMWSALHTDAFGLLSRVIQKIKMMRQIDEESESSSMKRLVICGHSLGGGYALLTALELYYMGARVQSSNEQQKRSLPLSLKTYSPEVVTFGCPQVIVPDHSSALWTSLKDASTCVVNSWDVISRMPSCEAWMFSVIPSPKVSGWFMAKGTKRGEKHLRPVWPSLREYDICGTIVFFDEEAPGSVVIVDCGSRTTHKTHRALIELTPKPPGPFIVAQHSICRYHELTALVHMPREHAS